ncbi:LSU ribosomal protein L15P [Desulfacinum infernum DSM 9756]|uniref:Large ribosomal subunit protein uL15 n=1 Tax=Desulfacinum infernum DSM 9756 TaxID=1121391 RepID=A0A1M4VUD1_9BACT|nr:50S ribosomal protein L15 [Desulfacinum infernum]SHE72527.1 LSU ribosomal protein L15P [Desulfacinum infernum DSM 9756]
MRLNELKPATGAKKNKKRVGRGSGSGLGKTAGRGTKGQKSRSGGGVPPWFEGGQMPLQRRVPKRGFHNLFRTEYQVVNVGDLGRFEAGAVVGPEELKAAGLVRKNAKLVKLLGNGEAAPGITLRVHKASASAVAKIEAAGGKVELL